MAEETVNNTEEQKEEVEETQAPEEQKPTYDHIRTGMVVRVHEKIKDVNARGEERERVQVFEGIVLGVRGGTVSRTITVRKNSKGFFVEKIYPLASPNIADIEVVKQFRTRRGKLTFIRGEFKRKMKEVK